MAILEHESAAQQTKNPLPDQTWNLNYQYADVTETDRYWESNLPEISCDIYIDGKPVAEADIAVWHEQGTKKISIDLKHKEDQEGSESPLLVSAQLADAFKEAFAKSVSIDESISIIETQPSDPWVFIAIANAGRPKGWRRNFVSESTGLNPDGTAPAAKVTSDVHEAFNWLAAGEQPYILFETLPVIFREPVGGLPLQQSVEITPVAESIYPEAG
jgi:hypothetical protein